jgi:4-hydroxythreonine-4-phosphate dehydrogenase
MRDVIPIPKGGKGGAEGGRPKAEGKPNDTRMKWGLKGTPSKARGASPGVVYAGPKPDQGPSLAIAGSAKTRAAKNRPTIAITMGDPGGIGAEVILKALADPEIAGMARYRILGLAHTFVSEAKANNISIEWPVFPVGAPTPNLDFFLVDYASFYQGFNLHFPRKANELAGRMSLQFVHDAIRLAGLLPPVPNPSYPVRPAAPASVDAVVTGPISKEAWALAGETRFPGHTELFASSAGASSAGMMFISPRLRVLLATVHIPLAAVPKAIERLGMYGLLRVLELGHQAHKEIEGRMPRIAVCGLNPHAGEGGRLGHAETKIIEPAITLAQEKGLRVFGPFPADTIYGAAVAGKYDLVVAMYHDQGLIPLKLLARDEAVNVTVGLPIVRTSPDHGTAFDIAGQGVADPGSMKAAIRLAVKMATARLKRKG